MKKDEIKIGQCYKAKVSDRIVTVRIDSTNSHGGWNATNTATGKRIRVKSAQRLRRAVTERRALRGAPAGQSPVGAEPADDPQVAVEDRAEARTEAEANAAAEADAKPTKKTRAKKAAAEPKPKRVSAIDAAAQVLAETGKPMRAKELIEAMAARGLWTSPNGKTPEATLYAAMLREITTKGAQARFRKAERGLFAFNAAAMAKA